MAATVFPLSSMDSTLERSLSNNLFPPSESTATRRLSDSIICGAQEHLAKESESELFRLRLWAAEAMKARPGFMQENLPLYNQTVSANTSPVLKQDCRSKSRSGMADSAMQSLYSNAFAFHTRPTYPLASSFASPTQLARSLSLRRNSISRAKPNLSRDDTELSSTLMPLSLNETQPKSTSYSDLLPPFGISEDTPVKPTLSMLSRKSNYKAQNLRLSLSSQQGILLSPDQKTPRAKPVTGLSSPTWTSSTCESENDKMDLMTPADEQGPRPRKKVSVPLTQPFASETPPLHSLEESGATEGMGVERGLDSLGTSGIVTPPALQSINIAAQPRFSRKAAVPLSLDFETYATNLNRSESHWQGQCASASALYPSEVPSNQEALGSSFDNIDREEAELARRRTTGGWASSKRDPSVVGSRRHVRAGTDNPSSSDNNNGIRTNHRLTNSVSIFPRTIEEDVRSGGRSQEAKNLRLHIDSGFAKQHSNNTSISSLSEAVASGFGSTPLVTPSGSHKAMLSPDTDYSFDRRFHISTEESSNALGVFVRQGRNSLTLAQAEVEPAGKAIGGLIGMGGGGHFGPGVRAKIAQILVNLVEQVPLRNEKSETVQLVEYGCLNSRSVQLMQPMITAFANKHSKQIQSPTSSNDSTIDEGYFADARQASHNRCIQNSSELSFQVTHEDSSSADFRPLNQLLEHSPESYLDAQWQGSHTPSLSNSIFSSFAARPFASKIAPPQTFHAGISLMDLHWIHTPINSIVPAATAAQAELVTFLSTRALEFKQGGLLMMAYIARSEEVGKDIWTTLSNTLAPCIQRLVSCSMVKSEVARHLLTLPMHPRSAKQTKAALESVDSKWKVEWSCGLGNEEVGSSGLASEPQPLRLPHPAWKAYHSGTLSRGPFTEHMIQLFKNLYESHFRNILREKGKLSKGAVEFVLDSLWDVLFSRIVDQEPSLMKNIEVEVSIVALRRR